MASRGKSKPPAAAGASDPPAAAGAAAAGAAAGPAATPASIPLYNRVLNILDPPKDLNSGKLTVDYGPAVEPSLLSLFWPQGGDPPRGFAPIKDTKNDIKNALGGVKKTGEIIVGPYSEFIINKANSLFILKNKTSAGYASAPSGLFVAQDAGPTEVVEDSVYLITPGTILDPASKDKNGKYFTDADAVAEGLNKLPMPYIEKLNLQNVITGEIRMDVAGGAAGGGENFNVTIPVSFDDVPIRATLLKTTFKPAGGGADWFLGNPAKEDFIKKNKKALEDPKEKNDYQAIKDLKKYLLIKELGDTLQVQWLNHIFDTGIDIPVDRDETGRLITNRPNKGNTVIITNDNVVFYRALINGVAVLLTYEGKSVYYRAFGDTDLEFVNASLINKIREEVIAHNESVIKTIIQVANSPPIDADNKWILGSAWRDKYEPAKAYLLKLAQHLSILNTDLDKVLKIAPSVETANEYAKRGHFLCPFAWVKGAQYYKTLNTVGDLLAEGGVKFAARYFRPEKFIAKEFGKHFKVLAGGGKDAQKGGARRSSAIKDKQLNDEKKKYENGADPGAFYSQLLAFLQQSINEFDEPIIPGEEPYSYDREIVKRVNRASSQSDIIGIKERFVDDNQIWLKNINSAGIAAKADLERVNHFLYCYVQEFFPEIFIYAYMVKSVGIAGFDLVTLDLGSAFDFQPIYNDDGVFKTLLVGGIDPPTTFKATSQAIRLAIFLTSHYPVLLSQRTADFLMLMADYFKDAADFDIRFPEGTNVGNVVEVIASKKPQYFKGGGKSQGNLIADIAMDHYEIFYSLQIQAAYEKRHPTEEEFITKLQGIYQSMASEIQPMPATGLSPAEARLLSPISGENVLGNLYGGRRTKYKKTRKQKKRSTTRRRKTRKQK